MKSNRLLLRKSMNNILQLPFMTRISLKTSKRLLFLVTVIEHSYGKRLDNKYNSTVSWMWPISAIRGK